MNDAKPCALDLEGNAIAVVAAGDGASYRAIERMAER